MRQKKWVLAWVTQVCNEKTVQDNHLTKSHHMQTDGRTHRNHSGESELDFSSLTLKLEFWRSKEASFCFFKHIYATIY